MSILINDSEYVALKILDEVIWNVVMDNTTNAVLVIVERDERISTPHFTENLDTVESIGMENTVYFLARSNTVCIVGIFDVVELLKLASLFPSQSVTEVGGTTIVFLLYHF